MWRCCGVYSPPRVVVLVGMSRLVVRVGQFSLEFECCLSFQLKDIPEFLEKYEVKAGRKKPLYVVAANGDSFCAYCLEKEDEVTQCSDERVYSIFNEAYPDLCQHSQLKIERMKQGGNNNLF